MSIENVSKQEKYRLGALRVSKRISSGDAKEKPWYLLVLIPTVLLVGLFFSPGSWTWALGMFLVAFVFFYLRMELWKTGNERLELIFFVSGTFIILASIAYLLITQTFEWGKLLIILGAFYSTVLIMRTLFNNKINTIAKELKEKYGN